MVDEVDFFKEMTFNAESWSDYFHKEGVQRDKTDRYAETLRRVQRDILAEIIQSIKDAVSGSKEYSRYGWMQSELVTAFNNPNIIRVDPETGILDLFAGAEEEAGDFDDFWSGYEEAVAEIAPNAFRADPERRAEIWEKVVYPSNTLYSKTMALRRRAWGDKAPWWNWIEYGNIGLSGAFPQDAASSFLFLAQDRARAIYSQALANVENEEFNVVEQAYARFLLEPDAYKVFDVLGEFYQEGKKFKIYVTPTRRLGVAQRIRR